MNKIKKPQTAVAESTAAISVMNLSKCYQLYAQPHDRLKQFLWRGRRQYFREFWALRDISFEVAKGEVLGIAFGAREPFVFDLIAITLRNLDANFRRSHGKGTSRCTAGTGRGI